MDKIPLNSVVSDVIQEWKQARELVEKHGKEKPDSTVHVPDSVTLSENKDVKKAESPKFHAVETKTKEFLASGSHIDEDSKTPDEITVGRNEETHVYERSGPLGLIPKEDGLKRVIRETLTDFKEEEVGGRLLLKKTETTWTTHGYNAVAGKAWTEITVDERTGQLLEYEIADEKGVEIIVHKGEVVERDSSGKIVAGGGNPVSQNVRISEAKGATGVLFQEPVADEPKQRLLASLEKPSQGPSDDLQKATSLVYYLRDVKRDPEILEKAKKFFEDRLVLYKDDGGRDGQLATGFLLNNYKYLVAAEKTYALSEKPLDIKAPDELQKLILETGNDLDYVKSERDQARAGYRERENSGPEIIKRAYQLEVVTLGFLEGAVSNYLHRLESGQEQVTG